MIPQLKHSADWRTLFFLFGQYLTIGLHVGGIMGSWYTFILACFFAQTGCVITHNHIHCPTFRGRFWNSVFSGMLSLSCGQAPTAIISAHVVRHHGKLESDEDFVRSSLAKYSRNWINLIVFPFVSIFTMLRTKSSDLKVWRKTSPQRFRQAIWERIIYLIGLSTFLLIDWKATILFVIVPWFLGQLWLVGINLIWHQDCDIKSKYNHSRNVIGKAGNFFLFNNGFHTAHHIAPGLHWSLLPAYHEEKIVPFLDPQLSFRTLGAAVLNRLVRRTSH